MLLLAVVAGWHWRHRTRCRQPALIVWHTDGRWLLSWPGRSEPSPARLRHARAVGPLVALELRELSAAGTAHALSAGAGRTLTIALWPDSADADQLRRLRIRLQRETGGEEGSDNGTGIG